MVTIKQIADLCGVSRGTVDRVINERGNVKPETKELVLSMAKELGYKPNPAGKALSARKKNPVVGVVISSEGNPFFDDVIRGIKLAAEKYEIYGLKVIWKNMRGYDVKSQHEIMEELKDKVNALIINPVNDPVIINEINEFVDAGIFVVTINNDVDNSKRQCYVGSDYTNGGETAGALLQMIIPNGANIGIVMGSSKVLGHKQRLAGFEENINKNPKFKIVDIQENDDDDISSYDKTKMMLIKHKEINAIFIVAAGVYGACRAVLSLGKQNDLTIIAFDTVPTTVEMMKKNVIKAVIYQHPYRQGQRAMQIVFEYLVNGISHDKSRHIMKNEIIYEVKIMKSVHDIEFKQYGRVLDVDTAEFVATMKAKEAIKEGVVYEPSDADLEALPLFKQMQDEVYGGLEVEFGFCSGYNNKLNAVEYHRSSEIDIAATDLILMLGRQQDIDYTNNTYETKNIECFFVPAGTAVELYATTLHYAPCKENNEEFRCGVVLPKGTNLPLQVKPVENKGENQLLFAANKWLIGHSESGVDKDGGFIGLIGENTTI